jgi:ABC-type Fe3+ transport system permease subunit
VAFGGAIRFGAFGLLLTWYFVSAKPQARFIKERFGKDYPRRGWGRPFLYALLVFVAVMLVAFLGGIIFAVVTGVLNGRVA